MATDIYKNFSVVTVSGTYDNDDTSVTLQSGDGAKVPPTPCQGVWWNWTDYPSNPYDDPNVEISRVVNRATDVLTLVRPSSGNNYNEEGPSNVASSKNTSGKVYKIMFPVTQRLFNFDLPATYAPYRDTGLRVFDVKAYGAKGDGVTDDTAAINAANSAAVSAGGGMLFFPFGVYIYGDTLLVGEDIVVAGVGSGSVLQRENSFTGLLLNLATNGCSAFDFTIDGNYSNNTGNTGAELALGSHSKLHRLHFKNSNWMNIQADGVGWSIDTTHIAGVGSTTAGAPYGIWFDTTGSDGIIKGCTIHDMRYGGIFGAGAGVVIIGNDIYSNHHSSSPGGGGQIAIKSTGKNVAIIGNRIGPSAGTLTSGIEADAPGMTITGNVIDGQDLYGIIFQDADDSTAMGNIITDSGSDAIYVSSSANRNVVMGNALRGTNARVNNNNPTTIMGANNVNGAKPRVETTASSASPTPNSDLSDVYTVTALAVNATFGAPTGTPTQGQSLLISIKDNGTARTLAWNSIYRATTTNPLPTTTIVSTQLYLEFVYNSTAAKWDLVANSDKVDYTLCAARVYHNGNTAIADQSTAILSFNTERFDTDGIHDNATNNSRLTCKTAGKYQITANIAFEPNANGYREVNIILNGTTRIAFGIVASSSSTNYTSTTVTTVWDLGVNDYVQVEVFHNAGSTLNVMSLSARSPEFMMARM